MQQYLFLLQVIPQILNFLGLTELAAIFQQLVGLFSGFAVQGG